MSVEEQCAIAKDASLSDTDPSKLQAMDQLVYVSNRDDYHARLLVNFGILDLCMKVIKATPDKTWDSLVEQDADHPMYWLAFDILTNLCKWTEVKPEVVASGAVEFLAKRISKENYFGFEATEGLAYIVGRDESGKYANLLQARQANIDLIITILKGSVDNTGRMYFGMAFGIYGRVLALQCLSVSDAYKPMLKAAIAPLFAVLRSYQYDEKSCETAAKALLELSFNEDNLKAIKEIPDAKEVLESCNSSDDMKKHCSSLIFRMSEAQQRQAFAKGVSVRKTEVGRKVMISYNWKSQEVVKELAAELKRSGLDIWVDFEQMAGDTIEAMASAVENCGVFIMCMTQRYKESGNCRLEANYAFKWQKPIIPLLMEDGYQADGWLGMLASNLLYYEVFGTGDIPKVLPKVTKEIQDKLGTLAVSGRVPTHRADNSETTPTSPSSKMKNTHHHGEIVPHVILDMTNADVTLFIKDKCGIPKMEYYIKKSGANGHTMGMIHDIHCRGGNAMEALKELGIKRVVDCMEVLYQLRVLATSS